MITDCRPRGFAGQKGCNEPDKPRPQGKHHEDFHWAAQEDVLRKLRMSRSSQKLGFFLECYFCLAVLRVVGLFLIKISFGHVVFIQKESDR